MYVSRIVTLLVAFAAETALGHMNMADPPPLRYKGNPNAVKAGKIDTDITSPNTAATFPCKGAIPDMDDPIAGAPVATWYPGEQHTVKIVGGASHNGGSCQLSISYDKGQTFTVVFSKIGACPTDPNIPFTLPADAPSADKVLFSWSWINHTGNREFYNNCAVLTIGAAKKKRATPAVAFKDRPPMLVADIYHTAGAACVKEGVDALYPEPGPDFVNISSNAALPDDCVTGQPMSSNPIVGGSGGSGSGGAPASGSASAPAGPGVAPSSGPGQLPTTSASAVYVSSSSSSFSSSLSLQSVPPMLSSLLLPSPSSTVDLVSPSSATPSTFVVSPMPSSLDGGSTLATSTRSTSSSSASDPAPSPSLVVIPITSSRRNNTATPTPSETSSATKSKLLTSSSSHSTSNSVSHSTPGGIFIPSSTITSTSSSASSSASASASLSSGSGAAPPTNTPTPSSPNVTPSVSSIDIPTTSSASATSSEVIGLPSQSSTATSSAAPPTGTGSSGGGVLSGPCQPEGEWNCLSGGTSWQRCASGLWSVVVPMAPGTSCTPGQSSNLNKKRQLYVRRRNAPRRDPVRRRAQAGAW